ncbi:major facilitator superfamily protein [Stylonychia lemnae]|uniref:Major facilitator superfamily protein n=1 Tax=Stylonychia lemnae TaxID=5949 RepID=A0A078A5M0_STYLE|nr:major facilitator superfamily protein [Stylonychia lemnae]|eukprot:CDW77194.1 major facilitator superfamily protein [Stylonychia lemnae]
MKDINQNIALLPEDHKNRQKYEDARSMNHKGPINDYLNFGKAFMCSLGFLGLYTTIYSAQNIQTVVFQRDGYDSLGFYSNAVAYLFQGLGSVFCVFIQEKIGDILTMAYGAVLNIPFMIIIILPALKSENLKSKSWVYSNGFVYAMILLASVFNGFGQGISQPSSGTYIAQCATEKTKGFFFAFYWAFYMGSQVFGSLIAAFVLGAFDQKYFVIIMAVIGIASCILLFFLKKPIVQHQHDHHFAKEDKNQIDLNEEEKEKVEEVKRESEVNQQKGESRYSLQTKKLTLKQAVASMWKFFYNKRFLVLAPQLFWTGISIAYYSGNLVEMMSDSLQKDGKDDQEQFKLSMLAMVLFGVGEILGCFFIGFIVDRKGSKVATIFNLVIILIMGAVTITFIEVYKYGALAFIMCFFWGFQDSAINTHSQEILGFEFDNNSEPFSVYNILQCVACFIFQIIESAVNDQDDYRWYTIMVTGLGFIFCGMPFFFDFHEKLDTETVDDDFDTRPKQLSLDSNSQISKRILDRQDSAEQKFNAGIGTIRSSSLDNSNTSLSFSNSKLQNSVTKQQKLVF